MNLHSLDLVMLFNKWAGSPHFWIVYPQHDRNWFVDIALNDDWAPLREMMSPLFTLEDELYTLDIEYFEDDITHVMDMMMVGPSPSLGHPWLMNWGT
jgi:hypothetical protein